MVYDGGQQHFGPGPGAIPRIEPGELRPKRLWYVVAGLVGAVFLGLGIVSLVLTLTGAVDSVDTEGRFRGGESLTLNLERGQERAVFVDLLDDSSLRYNCRATGPSDPSLDRPGSSFTVSTGGHTWQRVLILKANSAGEHTLTCQAGAGTEFAVGEKPGKGGFLGGLLLTIGLPALGLIGCTLIAVLTAVRRGRHRKRLLAERSPYGGQPAYGQSPGPYGQPPYGQPPQGRPPYGQPPSGGQQQGGWGPPPQ